VLRMSPCFMEQGMGRTSMTLLASINGVVCVIMCSLFLEWPESGDHTHMSAAVIAHHGRMPRGVPNDFNLDILNRFEAEKRRFDAPSDAFVHGATLGRQSHMDGHIRALNLDAINEPEVYDIAANLRVDDLAESLQNYVFVE